MLCRPYAQAWGARGDEQGSLLFPNGPSVPLCCPPQNPL